MPYAQSRNARNEDLNFLLTSIPENFKIHFPNSSRNKYLERWISAYFGQALNEFSKKKKQDEWYLFFDDEMRYIIKLVDQLARHKKNDKKYLMYLVKTISHFLLIVRFVWANPLHKSHFDTWSYWKQQRLRHIFNKRFEYINKHWHYVIGQAIVIPLERQQRDEISVRFFTRLKNHILGMTVLDISKNQVSKLQKIASEL